jgi:hypothetical protein
LQRRSPTDSCFEKDTVIEEARVERKSGGISIYERRPATIRRIRPAERSSRAASEKVKLAAGPTLYLYLL